MLIRGIFSGNCHKNEKQKFAAPSFGYRLPKKAMSDLREIPHLNCGCCNIEMLTHEGIEGLLKTFAAGSKSALEHTLYSKMRESESFQFVKKLAEKFPKKTIKELLEKPVNVKKISGFNPINKININHIEILSETIGLKAPEVMEKLRAYRSRFKGEFKELLEIMDIYSCKYPNNTFSEIFRKPEVALLHSKLEELNKKMASLQQINVFKEISRLSSKLNPQERKELINANSNALVVLNNRGYKPNIREALVKEFYTKFAQNCSDKETAEKILSMINDFHFETNAADKFIADYNSSQRGDMFIIKQILNELEATYEHVLAESKGGSEAMSNGIVLCKYCNNERAALPYPFFLKLHPEMPKNLQKQINKVISHIKHGNLLCYDDYPSDIKMTLLKQTDNMIKLKINEYLKYREEIAIQKLEQSKAIAQKSKEDYKIARENLTEVEKKIEEALAAIRKLKKERNACAMSLQKAQDKNTEAAKNLESKEFMAKYSKKLIEKDNAIEENFQKK